MGPSWRAGGDFCLVDANSGSGCVLNDLTHRTFIVSIFWVGTYGAEIYPKRATAGARYLDLRKVHSTTITP